MDLKVCDKLLKSSKTLWPLTDYLNKSWWKHFKSKYCCCVDIYYNCIIIMVILVGRPVLQWETATGTICLGKQGKHYHLLQEKCFSCDQELNETEGIESTLYCLLFIVRKLTFLSFWRTFFGTMAKETADNTFLTYLFMFCGKFSNFKYLPFFFIVFICFLCNKRM